MTGGSALTHLLSSTVSPGLTEFVITGLENGLLLLLPSTSCSPVILDSPKLTRALQLVLNRLQEGNGAAGRRGRWAGISLVYHLTVQKAITEAPAEAVDGGPSEKAGIPLLALTAQGGASPQLEEEPPGPAFLLSTWASEASWDAGEGPEEPQK